MKTQQAKQVKQDENNYEENKEKVFSLLKELANRNEKLEHRNQEALIFFISKWFYEGGRELMHDCTKACELYDKIKFDEKYTDCIINKEAKKKIFKEANIYGISKMLALYGIDATQHGINLDNLYKCEVNSEKDNEIIYAMKTSQELTDEYKGYSVRFIMNPIIFQNGVNILGAERGTGKTRISLATAFAITYGLKEFLGYEISDWGDVLFLNFEMAEPEFKLFVAPIENYFKSQPNAQKKYELHSISFKSYPELSLKDIADAVKRIKPLLIVVDGFKAFSSMLLRETGEREITNANAMKVYNYFDEWRRIHRTTILLTNHTNKGTKGYKSHSDLMYGVSALTDYADHTTLLRKTSESNQRLIAPDKPRFSREGSSGINLIELDSEDDGNKIWFDVIEKDVNESDYMYKEDGSHSYTDDQKEMVLKMHKEGKSYREIAKETGISKSTVERWIKNDKK